MLGSLVRVKRQQRDEVWPSPQLHQQLEGGSREASTLVEHKDEAVDADEVVVGDSVEHGRALPVERDRRGDAHLSAALEEAREEPALNYPRAGDMEERLVMPALLCVQSL